MDAGKASRSCTLLLKGLQPVIGPAGLLVLEGERELSHQTVHHRLHILVLWRWELDEGLVAPHSFRQQNVEVRVSCSELPKSCTKFTAPP